ncbi:hypothetical protein [Pontibacter anaerobius]|uniref:NodB homology domain-containing protein n=1 Tax=Pontibacter anaerobius TaxID=2993940 RepID=A0ABT3RHY8_9BACT|nr:hypothetical protein [Pontibacter anaerobius]MCX2740983.1 hypothetical protein [Pontibacter anaerobius]
MDIFITFDYELFFGENIGTAERCVILPTKRLIELSKELKAKFTFFVDVLYLIKLEEYSHVKQLDTELQEIKRQLQQLVMHGHDLQLHLHTHWINATYNGVWSLDYENYRIQNFSTEAVERIVHKSVSYLQTLTQRRVFAFRAGGWCLQPFDKLYSAFLKNGISLDSSVYHKGFNQTPTNLYDFRHSPNLDMWRFNNNPLKVEPQGDLIELPIASYVLSPLFYWKKLLLSKLLFGKEHVAGDGKGIPHNKIQIIRFLTTSTSTAVSCDGLKSFFLEKAFNQYKLGGRTNFVVIGHPKLLSSYAFTNLKSFISKATGDGHRFTSITEAFGPHINDSVISSSYRQ